jgi:hypothetical protein
MEAQTRRRPAIRRSHGLRLLLVVGGFLLAGAAAAVAYWTISVVYGGGNYTLAQATSLAAPTSPTVSETAATTIRVGWTASTQPTDVVEQYTVTRTSPGTPATVCTVARTVTSCDDTGLTPGATYGYSVVAVLDNWQSSAITTSATVLGVTTSSLPDGTVGVSYSKTLAATGGSGSYTNWAVTAGTLPSWATLNAATGAITGTPDAATTTSGLEFTVTDSNGFTASSGSLSLTVNQGSTTTSLSISPSSVDYGNEQTATFTSTVTPQAGGTPTGTITIKAGATTLCTIAVPTHTTCTGPATGLAASGTAYSVTATYGGDTNFTGSSSGAHDLTVNQDSTTATVSVSPTTVTYGNESAAVFTVSVTTGHGEALPASEPVTVHVGSASCVATLAALSGSGTCSLASGDNTALGVAGSSYAVTATYPGDTDLAASALATAPTPLSVTKDTTTTTVSESPTSVVYGNESTVTFTVGVTAHYGETMPAGDTVTVHAGTATCTVTLPATTCTIGDTALGASGSAYAVSADYNGDANLQTSAGNATTGVTVSKDATATTVAESPTTVTYGSESSVTFTAGVTAHFGEPVPNGDTITVGIAGGGVTCTVVLPATTCTISDTALHAGGPYSVTDTYNGDGNLETSTANAVTGLTVGKATLTVTASTTSTSYGTVPTVTPNYSGFKGTDGVGAIGTAPTCSSTVTVTTVPGVYPGANTCTGGTATDYTFSFAAGGATVNKATPSNVVTNSSPTTVGTAVTFTATLSGPVGAATPTGTVSWTVSGTGGKTACDSSTTTLSGGTATCTITPASAGTYIVSDSYGGDGNYSGPTGSNTDTVTASATVFGATDLGNTAQNPDTSVSNHAIAGPTVTTTSGRAELIFVHVRGANNGSATTVASITGPFTGATQVAGFSYATNDYEFVWKATGNGTGPTQVAVTFNSGTTSAGGVAVDVVQLNAGNAVVACNSCTNSGSGTATTATLSIQNAADTEVAFFGIDADKTFSIPTGFSTLADDHGHATGTAGFATNCGVNVQSSVASTATGAGSWGAIGIEIQATAPVCPPTATEIASVATSDTSAPYQVTSGTFTPANGATYLVFVGHISSAGGDATTLGVTGSLSVANGGNPITSTVNGATYGWAWEVTASGTSASTITATFTKANTKTVTSDVMQVIQISGTGATPFVGSGTTTSAGTASKAATVNLTSPSAGDSEVAFLYVNGDIGGSDPGWATPGVSTITNTFQHHGAADTGFGTIVGYASQAVSTATTTSGKFPATDGDPYVGIAFELVP